MSPCACGACQGERREGDHRGQWYAPYRYVSIGAGVSKRDDEAVDREERARPGHDSDLRRAY